MVTALVLTGNVTEVAPAGTVTVGGTVTVVLDEVRETTTPLGPAAPFSVIVAVLLIPPVTVAGARERAEIGGGVAVSVSVSF